MTQFFAEMKRKGIYSKGWDEFFPRRVDGAVGYDQVVVLDLTPYNLDTPVDLVVAHTFDAVTAGRWFLRSYPIIQKMAEFNERDGWSFKEV